MLDHNHSTQTGKPSSLARYEAAIELSDAPDRLVQFLEIYEEARGDRLVPTRADLSFRRLARLLPDITIMERSKPGSVVYRLMGTAVVERIGADLTGHNYLNYLTETERARNDFGMAIVAEIPCGTYSIYDNQYASGVCSQNESLMLPIDNGAGEGPYQILGMHLAQNPLHYGEERDQTVIGIKWRKGVVIDLGRGAPDQAAMEALKPPLAQNEGVN
ncbi:MAG: PAS domain-containing protein [Candidatus Phaeomarinobacter sp.]